MMLGSGDRHIERLSVRRDTIHQGHYPLSRFSLAAVGGAHESGKKWGKA